MTRQSIKPAGRLETAVFLAGLVVAGSALASLGIYALLSSRGDVVTRLALAVVAIPTGLGMLYLGLGGFTVWLMEARERRRARRLESGNANGVQP